MVETERTKFADREEGEGEGEEEGEGEGGGRAAPILPCSPPREPNPHVTLGRKRIRCFCSRPFGIGFGLPKHAMHARLEIYGNRMPLVLDAMQLRHFQRQHHQLKQVQQQRTVYK